MMNQEKIGKYIAIKRKEKNLTQEEFAVKLGITFKAVSKWECGKGLPDVSLFNEICNILNISLEELLSGEDKSKGNNETINYIKYQKKNYRKKSIIGIILSLFIIMFLILLIYFVNNYNKIKVYKLAGEGENFDYNESLFMSTNIKNIFVFGNVLSKNEMIKEKDIKQIYLMYNDEEIVGGTYSSRGIIYENYGYDEIFSNEITNNIDKWFIEIVYENNNETKKEFIKLENEEQLINNSFFERKENKISTDNIDRSKKEKINKEKEDYKQMLIDFAEKNTFVKTSDSFYEKKNNNEYTNIIISTIPQATMINYSNKEIDVILKVYAQIYTIKDVKNTFNISYERKRNQINCFGKCPNDLEGLVHKYVEYFDKNYGDIIPQESHWGTLQSEEKE